MKFLQILIIIFAGFVLEANAQLCGQYGATVKVTNQAGKPIAGAKVRLMPLQEKDYTPVNNFAREETDASRFYIFFNEGHSVKGKFKVVVTAPGFAPAEKEIAFPHCARTFYEAILKPKSAKSVSVIRDLIKIAGEIYSNNASLGLVELTATDGDGGIFKTQADKGGRYRLELPYGDYTFVYRKAGYKTLKVVNVGIKEPLNFYLYSVELEAVKPGEKDNIIVKDFKDLYKSMQPY